MSTFVCSNGSRTQGVWKFLEKANEADADVMQAKLEHLFLKKISYCVERVPIYVHFSFYWALKVRFNMDVGGESRNGRVTLN